MHRTAGMHYHTELVPGTIVGVRGYEYCWAAGCTLLIEVKPGLGARSSSQDKGSWLRQQPEG